MNYISTDIHEHTSHLEIHSVRTFNRVIVMLQKPTISALSDLSDNFT